MINSRRQRLTRALVVTVCLAFAPGAHAEEFRGIGQAVGALAGGLTAVVVAPIAGGVASTSPRVSFWPATGISFVFALLLGAAGMGTAAADMRGGSADLVLPPAGAAVGGIGAATVYWALSPDPAAPAPAAAPDPAPLHMQRAIVRF